MNGIFLSEINNSRHVSSADFPCCECNYLIDYIVTANVCGRYDISLNFTSCECMYEYYTKNNLVITEYSEEIYDGDIDIVHVAKSSNYYEATSEIVMSLAKLVLNHIDSGDLTRILDHTLDEWEN